MQSLEILLVVDNEDMVHALSAILRRAGHRVITSTTIAGTIETLMRHGSQLDVIMTSTRFDSSLGDDVVQYSRKFAANARLIVLREVSARAPDLALALADIEFALADIELGPVRKSPPARLPTGEMN